jgi:hypothetical protein
MNDLSPKVRFINHHEVTHCFDSIVRIVKLSNLAFGKWSIDLNAISVHFKTRTLLAINRQIIRREKVRNVRESDEISMESANDSTNNLK